MTTEPAASCPSTFTLDRFMVGELTTEQRRILEDHLAWCASCRARAEDIARFNADFAVPSPCLPAGPHGSTVALPQAPLSGPWKRLAFSGAFVSALGALAAIFLLYIRPSSHVEEVSTKGGVRLGYHVSRDGAVWLAGPNEELRENDAIQFIFAAAEPGYLAVFSVDGRGEISSYYPAEGQAAADYQPEQSRLATSTVLDATLGDEAYVAVFCPHPFKTDEVVQVLEKLKASPQQLRFRDCSVETLRAKKVEP